MFTPNHVDSRNIMVVQSEDGKIMSQRELQWIFDQKSKGMVGFGYKDPKLNFHTQSQHHRFQRMKEGMWGQSFKDSPIRHRKSKMTNRPSLFAS